MKIQFKLIICLLFIFTLETVFAHPARLYRSKESLGTRRVIALSIKVNLCISSKYLEQRVARILNNRRIVEILNKIQNVSPKTRIYISDIEDEGFIGLTKDVIYAQRLNSLSQKIEDSTGVRLESEDGFINIPPDISQKSDEWAITCIEHELWHIYRFLAEPREVLRWCLWGLFDLSARRISDYYSHDLMLITAAITDFNLSMYQIREGSANIVISYATLPIKINYDKEDISIKGILKLNFISLYICWVLPFYFSSSEAQKNGNTARAEELREQGDSLSIMLANNYSDFLSEEDVAQLISGPIAELEKELKKHPYPRIKRLITIMQNYWSEYDPILF